MFLIKLDAANFVLQCSPSTDVVYVPMGTRMSDYILHAHAVTVGQEFDPETMSFLEPARRKWLTKLAFDNRFTMAEAVKLKLAQAYPTRAAEETDLDYNARCALPAQLQVMAGRLAMATYIDLDREDTIAGVTALEQLGLLSAGRAGEILSDAIATHEYHPDA